MEALLFLPHRIPYPPNKGCKIRTFHLLQYLSKHYRIFLGTFVDEPEDWQYLDEVRAFCADAKFIKLSKSTAKLASLRALLTGEPMTLPYFRSAELKRWVGDCVRKEGVERILVCSSSMAQYVADFRSTATVVVDFIDVDSEKWRQYGLQSRWPLKLIYSREGRELLNYEREVAAWSDFSVFVSEPEARLFLRRAGEHAKRVGYVCNGVDSTYFSAAREYPNPYKSGNKVLVFVGAMDYTANIDAVTWFATEVFGDIRSRSPGTEFVIVGSRPASEVRALVERYPGVCVVGSVDDVRPYLAHAHACVAPMRVARGLQNKVLEAFAMGKAVLGTTAAMEGVTEFPGRDRYVADTSQALVDHGVALLSGEAPVNHAGRECIVENFNWSQNLARVCDILEAGQGITADGCDRRSLQHFASLRANG